MKKLAYRVVWFAASAALWAHGALAAEVSLAIAPTNWVTCLPVATATFSAELDSVVLEWAPGDAGAFTQIATCPDPSAETWTVELPGTVVGQPRRYRLAMTSGGSTSYSDPVAFTRFRNLDRNPRDRTALATGVYPVLSADSNSMKPFNAYTGDWADSDSYQNVGLKFTNGKVYVAGIRVYPRSNNIGRLNNRNFFGAESASTYSTDYSAIGYISGLTAAWHYFSSTDTSTAFECCWLRAEHGNIAEMEVYGWTDVDLADAGGAVEIGFVPYSAAETNVWPIVTATCPYGVDSAAIEIGRRVDGDFEAVKSVTSPDGTPFSYTNLECMVGQTRYYRLKTVTGGSVYTSTPKKFTRFRWLERGPETPSAVRSGYSIIAGTSARAKYPFNGTTAESSDATTPCGINFNEQVYVAGVRYYPRPNWAERLSSRYTYASATASDYSSGTKTPITPFLYCTSDKWYWYDSMDVDSPYQYVYISPDSGSIGEMEIFGWTAADIAAAADPFFPTELTAINGDAAGKVVLAWGGGLNLDSYSVQYRQQGYEGWTTAADGLTADVESYELSGFEMNTTYEFRVLGHAGAESGSSPMASVYVYRLVPGTGTGLNTLLYGPIASRHLGQRFCFEQRLSPTVDVHQASGSFFSSTNLTSAMVIYRGKIILPLTGSYTFTAVVEGSDGSALYIDGSEGFNAFSGASLKKTTRTLAAGDHDIELIYRSVNTKKSFTFTWALEGVWDDRPVPMSQLKPAANSEMNLPDENATYDGWDFAPAIGSASYIPRFWRLGNGSFRMTGEKADYHGASPEDMLALLTRGLDGPFTLTADFHTSSTVGRPSLFVSKSATSLYGNSLSYIYGDGQVGMKGGPGVADWGGVSWKSAGGSTRRLRVKRLRDKTITFSDMDVASGIWVTRLTMPQGVYDGWSLAADKLWVGISLFGNTSQRSDVTFTNLKLSLENGTVIWLK